MCHFVFWLKIITAVVSSICGLLLRLYFVIDIKITPITIIDDTLQNLQCTLLTVGFSAIDCFQLSRKSKILIGLSICIGWTVYAIDATLLKEDMITSSTIHFSSWLKLSIGSIVASTSRVLCIFLWKQTFLLLIKKDRCINIRYSPYIKWVTD